MCWQLVGGGELWGREFFEWMPDGAQICYGCNGVLSDPLSRCFPLPFELNWCLMEVITISARLIIETRLFAPAGSVAVVRGSPAVLCVAVAKPVPESWTGRKPGNGESSMRSKRWSRWTFCWVSKPNWELGWLLQNHSGARNFWLFKNGFPRKNEILPFLHHLLHQSRIFVSSSPFSKV